MWILGRAVEYMRDIAYARLRYTWGDARPDVVEGYFADDENGNYQRIFYDELLKNGFKRTRWQLIFPRQTAGLVRRIKPAEDGFTEDHIRFYEDGVISLEREARRTWFNHWRGERHTSVIELERILNTEMDYLPEETKEGIQRQLAARDYPDCIRANDAFADQRTIKSWKHAAAASLLVTMNTFQASYVGFCLLDFSLKGVYYALEPGLILLCTCPITITYIFGHIFGEPPSQENQKNILRTSSSSPS